MYLKVNLWIFVVAVSIGVDCDKSADIVSNRHLFPTLPVAPEASQNPFCKRDSEVYVSDLNNLTLWAHKMWDATAKSTSGVLDGNNFEMGDWDECMRAEAPFKTKFCFAVVVANVTNVEPPDDPYALTYDPMGDLFKRIYRSKDISQSTRDTIRLGWCIPASCPEDDLETFLNEYLRTSEFYLINNNVTYYAVVPGRMCQTDDEVKKFDAADGFFCLIVVAFIFAVALATMYDIKLEHELTDEEKHSCQKNILHRILLGFSAKRNVLELTKSDESNKALSSLYGLRTLAIFMIIFGHRFGTFTSGPIINYGYIETQYRSFAGWFIFHSDLFVDTFFIISGILVTYGLMSQYEKRYINPGYVVFLRYARLTPLYALVIFYYVTILNYIGSGPLWKLVIGGESGDCRNNWWTNLLYINNYVNDDHICMTQTWYLSCDLHYFIVALFLIILYKRNKRLALGLFLVLLISSAVIPFLITLVHLRPALLFFYPEFLNNPKAHPDFRLTYTKSHTRATPYFIGMVAGYIYYKMKGSEEQLSKVLSHFLTFIAIILLFVGMASGAVFYNPYHEYNAIESAVFAGLNRFAWSVGTVLLLLTGSFGHFVIFQKVLSWSPFIPLSKLVYGAYLIHMSFQFRALAMTTESQSFEYFKLFQWALGDIVTAFISGFVLYILVENPMRKLCREVFVGRRKTQPSSKVTERESTIRSNGNLDSKL